MNRLAVYCGSASPADPRYIELARDVGRTLAEREYKGWVSLEAFIFEPGGERIANESIRYLEGEIAKL